MHIDCLNTDCEEFDLFYVFKDGVFGLLITIVVYFTSQKSQ